MASAKKDTVDAKVLYQQKHVAGLSRAERVASRKKSEARLREHKTEEADPMSRKAYSNMFEGCYSFSIQETLVVTLLVIVIMCFAMWAILAYVTRTLFKDVADERGVSASDMWVYALAASTIAGAVIFTGFGLAMIKGGTNHNTQLNATRDAWDYEMATTGETRLDKLIQKLADTRYLISAIETLDDVVSEHVNMTAKTILEEMKKDTGTTEDDVVKTKKLIEDIRKNRLQIAQRHNNENLDMILQTDDAEVLANKVLSVTEWLKKASLHSDDGSSSSSSGMMSRKSLVSDDANYQWRLEDITNSHDALLRHMCDDPRSVSEGKKRLITNAFDSLLAESTRSRILHIPDDGDTTAEMLRTSTALPEEQIQKLTSLAKTVADEVVKAHQQTTGDGNPSTLPRPMFLANFLAEIKEYKRPPANERKEHTQIPAIPTVAGKLHNVLEQMGAGLYDSGNGSESSTVWGTGDTTEERSMHMHTRSAVRSTTPPPP